MAQAAGKYAKAISDRSGLEFPYNEMVKEWNGSTVHISEFEAKHPQLDPRYHPTDPQSLQNAKPQIISANVLLGINLFAGNIFERHPSTVNLDVFHPPSSITPALPEEGSHLRYTAKR